MSTSPIRDPQAFLRWRNSRNRPIPPRGPLGRSAPRKLEVAPEPEPEPWLELGLGLFAPGLRDVVADAEAEARIGFAHGPDTEALTWEEQLAACAAAALADGAGAGRDRYTGDDPILQDIESLESLVDQQEWKAAALIGGAALEALLLALVETRAAAARAFAQEQLSLSRRRRDDGARWSEPIGEWGLYGLTRCAEALGLLSGDETALCHRARRIRNSIHARREAPGRADAHEVRDAVFAALRKGSA